MATRSVIAIKTKEGIKSIYSHWDGYPDHHYPILFNHYNTTEKVEALLALGDVSVLDESLECPEGHTFDSRVKGYSAFYMRDRGEEGCEAIFNEGGNAQNLGRGYEAYLYVWNGEKWTVYDTYYCEPKEITSTCEKYL